jgi:hypothetical protein
MLQGYNAGNSYDIYWDHLTDTPTPIVATGANCIATLGTAFSGTVATFTTADTLDGPGVFQATITWGDGGTTTGTVTGGNGSFTVSGNHTFTVAGALPVSVLISSPTTTPGTATGTASVNALPPFLTGSPAFYQGNQGQYLIKTFNSNGGSKALGNWLATTFPNLFGASSGTAGSYGFAPNNLAGKNNNQVASYYPFLAPGTVQAEALTTALNIYATPTLLGGTAGTPYGFTVTAAGFGAVLFNVGPNGAAFGVANNSTLDVLHLLLAVNAQAVNGIPYGGDQLLNQEALAVLKALNHDGPGAAAAAALPRRPADPMRAYPVRAPAALVRRRPATQPGGPGRTQRRPERRGLRGGE